MLDARIRKTYDTEEKYIYGGLKTILRAFSLSPSLYLSPSLRYRVMQAFLVRRHGTADPDERFIAASIIRTPIREATTLHKYKFECIIDESERLPSDANCMTNALWIEEGGGERYFILSVPAIYRNRNRNGKTVMVRYYYYYYSRGTNQFNVKFFREDRITSSYKTIRPDKSNTAHRSERKRNNAMRYAFTRR